MIDLLDFSLDDVHTLDYIASGATREVYALSADLVVKVEPGPDKGQNRAEVDRWCDSGDQERSYLAPIVAWADDYSWLIMERADDVEREPYSREAHAFCVHCERTLGLCDLHYGNIGRNAAGNLVCIDYAN